MSDHDDYWTHGAPIAPRPVRARFDGMCPACDGRVHVDDEIVRDERGQWVHAECPETVDARIAESSDVCPVHFLVRPCGECEVRS